MKYVVVLMDGSADEPIEQLGGKTPIAYAKTPNIDKFAKDAEIALVKTIPEGCATGSDTANLSVMGYNPKIYHTGRSPLEALSMGVELSDTDVTFRTNVVTMSDEENYEDKVIIDHSADEISTEEAAELIKAVAAELGDDIKKFYPGVSYRHLLVWDKGSRDVKLTPPHDILDQKVSNYKPVGDHADELWEMMKKSYDILKDHPVNKAREAKGLRPANSIWIWGEGIKPRIESFGNKYGVSGAVISAVDLIKGIGIGAGMESIDVEGSTGNVHTNYDGKANAAIKWLIEDDNDFVYVHLEGPDECGHRAEIDNKVLSIELIDEKVIGPITKALEDKGLDYRLMVLPDHPTPIRLRTHTGNPVPYMIYDSTKSVGHDENRKYNEEYATSTNKLLQEGFTLMDHFLQK